MSNVFISYARAKEAEAHRIAEALRALGYGVWRDDELPAHRAYADVIEERLRDAKAVVVLWSPDAVASEWVRAEANRAREAKKIVQARLDDVALPLPFDQIQCADLAGWSGDSSHPGWRKVAESVAALIGAERSADAHASTVAKEHGGRDVRAPAETPGLALPDTSSIAVLPFTDPSGAAGGDYFAEGMMDELVAALTQVRSLFVIAAASTLSLKGQDLAPQEIGRRLGVRYLLDGGVRRSGDQVRISVRQTDALDGRQVWAGRFDGTMTDVFALQDRVAIGVAGVVEPAVMESDLRRIAQRPTESLGAYDLYLKANQLFWRFHRDDTRKALEILERALELDPEYGLALAFAALCHRIIWEFGWTEGNEDHRALGRSRADRALRLAGDDPRALAYIASALMSLDGSADHARVIIDRSLALNPGSAYAWLVSGLVRTRGGEPEAAIEAFEQAQRLDPISASARIARYNIGVALFLLHRFDEALVVLTDPITEEGPFPHAITSAVLGNLGRTTEAAKALDRYYAKTRTPIVETAALFFYTEADRALFMRGIAAASDVQTR